MQRKQVKEDIGFDEALRRIANTPKKLVANQKSDAKKSLVYNDLNDYNKNGEAAKVPPRPAKRKP